MIFLLIMALSSFGQGGLVQWPVEPALLLGGSQSRRRMFRDRQGIVKIPLIRRSQAF